MSAANSIPVSEELYREVAKRAQATGVSAEDWASSVLAARVQIERQTDKFFEARAVGASSLPLSVLLDKAPDTLPDPGDELPEGYIAPTA